VRRRRIVHRSDANQAAIVDALRAVGATVDVIGEPVDLLCGYRGKNYLMEVKPSEKSRLQPSQVEFFQRWRGAVVKVTSVGEALAAIGITTTTVGPRAVA
jgi:hypothetical protein